MSAEGEVGVPPEIELKPSGMVFFLGEPALLGGLPDAMLLLALAAPVFAVVFAVSIIFLKKPLFLALGAESPPSTPAVSKGLVVQSATGVGAGCVAWLEWKLIPVSGDCGLDCMAVLGRSSFPNSPRRSPYDLELKALSGRLPFTLPVKPHFRLAKLPALVALKAPAEWPLMILVLVIWVLVVLAVDVLLVPEDELVLLVWVRRSCWGLLARS